MWLLRFRGRRCDVFGMGEWSVGKSGKMGDERREMGMGMEIGRGGDAKVDEGKWGDDRWGFRLLQAYP